MNSKRGNYQIMVEALEADLSSVIRGKQREIRLLLTAVTVEGRPVTSSIFHFTEFPPFPGDLVPSDTLS